MTKRMIQPRISDHQEITNVVGIAIKNHHVAWCQLEKVKHEQDHYNQNTCTNILTKITSHPEDQGHTANSAGITHPNLWSVGTIDCKKIFESRIDVVDLLAEVQSIMDQIPASNVYILSERPSAQQSGPASERQSTAYATAHVTGLLTVLLNRKSLTGTSVSNSLQNSLYGKYASSSRTSGVYFVKESRITRSIHLQKGHDRWYGLRVLLALLQTGGPPGYLWGEGGCGISVPPHVSQRFRLLNSYDQHSQAAALCMALAFPAIYDE
ncbi:uncharacterized protein LOC108673718 [Hyalella azteca]|uniref:Uncharacterized protein LOC108673718 n=1 Tax=Hyalella azteca TaxID=294128 RepID=A0A8B7NTI6_HYAAZ|nr:uncharacterized protein LOC108673718 [Hyalella azteca]